MRLIDGDALIEKFNEKVDMAECLIDERTAERFATFCALADAVEEMPTVDAVEVVRCKDCKYYCQDKINGVICRHPALDFDTECFDHWINTNPDDFCSYGKRKEGAD